MPKNNDVPDLSVVVPVHNEAENIDPLIREIRGVLDPVLYYELIYVDDGSTDDTPNRLKRIAARFHRLRIITHGKCCGQSSALWTGVAAARASWIATLDGDGQNDPADILRLKAFLQSPESPAGLALICGHRKERRDTPLKRLSSRIANSIRGRLLKDDTPDTGCGLKLFSRDAFLRLPFFDHMHRFLPALMLRGGGNVCSVVVNHRPRLRGRSHYGVGNRLWVGMTDLLGVMWLQRRMQYPSITEERDIEN
jgi:dolichol-phosphate mannosyltransferase